MSCLYFWIEVTGNILIQTRDPLPVSLIGGVIHGIGIGIPFRGNVSTGGMDIIAKIVNQRFSISISEVSKAKQIVI